MGECALDVLRRGGKVNPLFTDIQAVSLRDTPWLMPPAQQTRLSMWSIPPATQPILTGKSR